MLWQLIFQIEKTKTYSIRWIIDGLDEAPTDQRVQFLRYLADLRDITIDFKILISCRYDENIVFRGKCPNSKILELDAARN